MFVIMFFEDKQIKLKLMGMEIEILVKIIK